MSNGLDPDEERCSVGATDLLICKYVKTDLWIYMYVKIQKMKLTQKYFWPSSGTTSIKRSRDLNQDQLSVGPS